jgi:hypothetical protein
MHISCHPLKSLTYDAQLLHTSFSTSGNLDRVSNAVATAIMHMWRHVHANSFSAPTNPADCERGCRHSCKRRCCCCPAGQSEPRLLPSHLITCSMLTRQCCSWALSNAADTSTTSSACCKGCSIPAASQPNQRPQTAQLTSSHSPAVHPQYAGL